MKRRGLINSQRMPDWKHSICEGYFLMHQVKGILVSSRTSLQVSMVQSMRVLLLYILGKSRIIVPLSGMINTPSGFLERSQTQLLHRNAATPPAEVPVIVMFVAEKRLYFSFNKLKWAIVLLLSRKQRFLSLNLIASNFDPVCRLPSQQGMKMRFHVWKGLILSSGARKAQLSKDRVGGYVVLLPRSVKDRLQQCSSMSASPSPRHNPPLQKQIKNLSDSVPAWKQRAGVDPSRHLAAGSVFLMSVNSVSAREIAAIAKSRQTTFIQIISNIYPTPMHSNPTITQHQDIDHPISNPAPDLIAYSSFSLMIFLLEYSGRSRQLLQV